MLTVATTSTSWFGARTVIAGAVVLAALVCVVSAQQTADGCKVECYPNTKMINGKGGINGSGKKENCRWILRTDGKPARLCDHIVCKKVCPQNQAQQAAGPAVEQQETASSSENAHIEQQLEADSPLSVANTQPAQQKPQPQQAQQPQQQPQQPMAAMGIMRQMHGNKLAKAPVPGVAGGRLTVQTPTAANQSPAAVSGGARRMAPTLAPAVEYDDKDTPPPISRFLDISPEE